MLTCWDERNENFVQLDCLLLVTFESFVYLLRVLNVLTTDDAQ